MKQDGETLVLSDSGSRPYPVLVAAAFAIVFVLGAGGLATLLLSAGTMATAGLVHAQWLSVALAFAMLSPLPLALIVSTLLLFAAGIHVTGRHPLVISPGGLKFDHYGGATVRDAKAVRLEHAAVGLPIVVRVVGSPTRQVLKRVPSVFGGPWDLDAIRWFARATATTLGVPLVDHLDHEIWDRWATDPSFRKKVAFERSVAENRQAFPEWHGQPPREPPSLRFDHHGLRVGQFRMRGGRVSDPRARLWLHEILDAQPHFERHSIVINGFEHVSFTGTVRVRTDRKIFDLGLRNVGSDSDAGEITWLASKIRELATDAEPPDDEGSASDIPDDLRDLMEPEEPE